MVVVVVVVVVLVVVVVVVVVMMILIKAVSILSMPDSFCGKGWCNRNK